MLGNSQHQTFLSFDFREELKSLKDLVGVTCGFTIRSTRVTSVEPGVVIYWLMAVLAISIACMLVNLDGVKFHFSPNFMI